MVEFIFNQLTIKAAMKLWDNDTTIVAEKEMKQLHWCKSFQPVCWIDLTLEQWSTVLESHIFVQKKRTGEVKARMVAGGNRQQGYINKEDATLPPKPPNQFSCLVSLMPERDKMWQ